MEVINPNPLPVSPIPSQAVANSLRNKLSGKLPINFLRSNSQNPTQLNPSNTNPKIESSKRSIASLISKFLLIISIIIAIITAGILSLYATNLDSQIFNTTFVGTVVGEDDKPIPNADVTINTNSKVRTNENGKFTIRDIEEGSYNISINASGFKTFEGSFEVENAFMDYYDEQTFKLESSSDYTLSGKFQSSSTSYKFVNDKLFVNGQEYDISDDGSFFINDLGAISDESDTSLEVTFRFESINFKDINRTITLLQGSNLIRDIVLEEAGDIVGELTSYIKEDKVTNIQIAAQNVLPENIIINSEEAKFLIKDLEVDREYDIRVSAEGYVTKDYKAKINQGENNLFNFKLVENGRTVFLKQENNGQNQEFLQTDYDGSNATQFLISDRYDLVFEYYNQPENSLYFLGKIQDSSQRGGLSASTRVPHILNLSTNQISILLNDKNNIGILVPNFTAKKILNITTPSRNNTQLTIEIMDLSGANRKELRKFNNASLETASVSDDGRFVYLVVNDRESGQSGLYVINVETNEQKFASVKTNLSFLDVSYNGEKVIFFANNTSNNFRDLLVYINSTGEVRSLQVNSKGTFYQFIDGSDNDVLYKAVQGGNDSLFLYKIDQNSSQYLLNLSSNDKINSLYQRGEYAYYITNNGLYLFDPAKPKAYTTVYEGDVDFTGFGE